MENSKNRMSMRQAAIVVAGLGISLGADGQVCIFLPLPCATPQSDRGLCLQAGASKCVWA